MLERLSGERRRGRGRDIAGVNACHSMDPRKKNFEIRECFEGARVTGHDSDQLVAALCDFMMRDTYARRSVHWCLAKHSPLLCLEVAAFSLSSHSSLW